MKKYLSVHELLQCMSICSQGIFNCLQISSNLIDYVIELYCILQIVGESITLPMDMFTLVT